MLGAPGAAPSPAVAEPPPSPSTGEGTAPTQEKQRGEVGVPAASSALTPLSPPERWTALPDFPDHDKWGFSLAALNSSVYVTGEALRLPPRAAAARQTAAVRTPTRRQGQLPLARRDPKAQSTPFRSSLWWETDANPAVTGHTCGLTGMALVASLLRELLQPGPCAAGEGSLVSDVGGPCQVRLGNTSHRWDFALVSWHGGPHHASTAHPARVWSSEAVWGGGSRAPSLGAHSPPARDPRLLGARVDRTSLGRWLTGHQG